MIYNTNNGHLLFFKKVQFLFKMTYFEMIYDTERYFIHKIINFGQNKQLNCKINIANICQ